MTGLTIRKTLYLNATPDQVWPWLTDPDKLGQWFHKATAELTTGEVLEMFGSDSGDLLIWGRVVEARAPEYLEYTFTIKPMGDAASTVKWWLETIEGGTRLSLEHSGLPAGAAAFGLVLSLDKGWGDHIARMRAALHDRLGQMLGQTQDGESG